MVQRKTPTKINKPQINDPKNAADHPKSKKKPSSDAQQQHQVHNQQQLEHVGSKMKQVVDFKKMMKKARSIKLIEKDLLKDKTPTPQKNKPSSSSSSSQKKTKSSSSSKPNYLKPTSSSDAMKSSKSSSINSNTARASSSTADDSGGKTLMKRLSFRLIKPWMGKSSEIVLMNSNPIAEVRKPTCSSTLKDSNFPKTLELNPGGREAEGTSVYQVCPYNHCSLNGHHHRHDEPPPPLRRVISVRRRMLKTQKNERLKGLASFKIRGSRKSRNEVHSEVVITRVPSMRAPVIEEVTDDYFVEIYEQSQSQKAVDVINVDENRVQEEFEDEISEVLNCLLLDGGEEGECENADEIYELGSDFGYEDEFNRYSDVSIEEMDVVMDFLEYIECDEEARAECQEDYAGEWGFDSMEKGHAESITNLSNFESTDSYWEEDIRSNIEQSNDLCQYFANGVPEEEERSNPECRECISDEFTECTSTNEQASGCYDLNQEKILDAEIDGLKEFECDTESESSEKESEKSEMLFVNVNSELPGQTSMEVCDHPDDDTDNISAERMENTILALCDEEKENRIEEFVEDDDGNSLIKIQFSNAPTGFYEIDMELPDGSEAMNVETEQFLNESRSRPKARYNYIRKRTAEDVHDMKQFNPRPPNFLPEEPDQERQKVDLRHQEMEDRKNAEEWMVDHTLQRTVSKLARARSRKVRLFVEAFETVIKPSLHV